MTTPQTRIIDGDTVTDRDMNADELAIYELHKVDAQKKEKAAADKAVAREALLERLGITDEEARMLLS